ncbi:NAD(P)-dependent dehydrogenase (short-subunit alcohol dehydrogenase family) [Altererythrobacter atlanticus]|uniref:7-alpha-hydroxysteroid dehydrogenase n=1 Tax=Croceibacterium atlanticum TaxID=1267766 RepID=A0A0F7KKV6_9SPHN|nr:SDR family oxidoreductase [Croceibacterium atlanticum]AKH41203.1 7-alpha-hydroxysteroid dehydrogenase [Croceibacterium atlanticum]MBB5732721.1 NAD(P)-dependent dehydrogenase (short-subunit alcohol dehydrogenase family) [Croceibacterium atlanticum]
MTRPCVLVTGGAKRIGAAIARRFGEAGWHVALHCNTSLVEAEKLAAQLDSAEVIRCDLADNQAARRMIADLAARHGDWRVLINSASVFRPDSATGLDPATNAQAMQINALAPALMAQLFFAQARSANGRRVIQLTDQKLANPNPDFFSYTMSKHALAATVPMLAMTAAVEDRIYELAPGAILASHDQAPEDAERTHRMNPLRRRTSAQEVADAAYFLATGPMASGQRLFIDSGQHLLSQPRDVMYLTEEGDERR